MKEVRDLTDSARLMRLAYEPSSATFRFEWLKTKPLHDHECGRREETESRLPPFRFEWLTTESGTYSIMGVEPQTLCPAIDWNLNGD